MTAKRIPIKQLAIRVNDEEFKEAHDKAHQLGLTVSAYFRMLIMGKDLLPQPPVEYAEFIRLESNIANNMNQIAMEAHTLHSINERNYEQIAKQQIRLLNQIREIVEGTYGGH